VAGARPPFRLATRGSALARWQSEHVAALLRAADPTLEVELVVVETVGDRTQAANVPLWEIGGKGVFVKEVQAAVLDGRADAAVHSAKDLPSETHEDLAIGAVPERADPRDVLVGSTLAALPTGALVATGSVRRRAQLAWLRPDLTFTGLRGNIGTRLDRAGEFGAIVLAAAALDRLGRSSEGAEVLEPSVMLPQVGQGCIAIECRAADAIALGRLGAIEHAESRRRLDAERAFLLELGGDCDLPAGAHATVVAGGDDLRVEGLLASLDGHVVMRHTITSPDGVTAGAAVANHLLQEGGQALLDR
jgi:hydroxymethylbilane synthase